MNFEENQKKSTSQLRSIYGLTMGVLWSAIGIFFLMHHVLFYALLSRQFFIHPLRMVHHKYSPCQYTTSLKEIVLRQVQMSNGWSTDEDLH